MHDFSFYYFNIFFCSNVSNVLFFHNLGTILNFSNSFFLVPSHCRSAFTFLSLTEKRKSPDVLSSFTVPSFPNTVRRTQLVFVLCFLHPRHTSVISVIIIYMDLSLFFDPLALIPSSPFSLCKASRGRKKVYDIMGWDRAGTPRYDKNSERNREAE